MKSNLVSIIIPIYNTKNLLYRCLESIQKQTYTNLEIVMIDDGSTDGSADICKSFCETDSRFKYIYQNNAGVSAARNNGLTHASGKYIGFVDSDDWIALDYYEALVSEMDKAGSDLVIAGFQIFDGEHLYSKTIPDVERTYTKSEFAKNIWKYCSGSTLINSNWNKLYRRDKICDQFNVDMYCGEDMRFNMMYLKSADVIATVQTAGYYYFKPATNSGKIKYPQMNAKQCFAYSDSVREFLASAISEEEYIEQYEEFLCGNMCRDVGTIARANDSATAKKLINDFYEYPEFCRALNHGAYKALGKKYLIVGKLLNLRLVSAIVSIARATYIHR